MDGHVIKKEQSFKEPLALLRPNIDKQGAVRLARLLFGLHVSDCSLIREFVSYDDRNFYLKGALLKHCSKDDNLEQLLATESQFVLKILNYVDSENIPYVNAQNEMMLHLKARGFVCPVPVRSLKGEYTEQCKLESYKCRDDEGKLEEKGLPVRVNAVRLLSFVPGKLLKEVPCTTDLLYNLGCYVAEMNKALQIQNGRLSVMWRLPPILCVATSKEFHHPDISVLLKQEWDLSQLFVLKNCACLVSQNDSDGKVLQHVYNQFVDLVIPQLVNHKKQVIHGDLNDDNIIVIPNHCSGSYEIGGLLDFGDSCFSYRVFEVAICMMYVILVRVQQGDAHDTAVSVAGHVLRGYQSVYSLSQSELSLLYWSVAARFFQSIVIGLYKQSLEPENIYLSQSSQLKLKILASYIGMPGVEVLNSWLSIGQSD